MMEDWYKKYIEPEILSLVRLLRNNGFNTESSCGHQMTVQCQYIPDATIKDLDDLMFNNGYRDYAIVITVTRNQGHSCCFLEVILHEGRGGKHE